MKKETKMILACVGIGVAGGIAGALLVKNNIDDDILDAQEDLDRVLADAKAAVRSITSQGDKAVRDMSVQINKAVEQVYDNEAKEMLKARLNDIPDSALNALAERMVKNEVNSIVTKVATNAANNAVNRINVKEMVKDYIDDNSVYFDRKITKSIRDIFDDEFVDIITKTIKEKIKEA